MARRKVAAADPEAGGFPKDGDEAPPDNVEQGDPGDEDNPTVDEPEDKAPVETAAEMELRLRKEYDAKLENLSRRIPPIEPKAPSNVPKEVDWNDLLFTNPKEAVRLIKAEAVKEAEDKLTASYQKDQGTRKFWDDFYKAHKDLRDDHDLVEVTLNSNLSKLANIPVGEAMTKLADLTRERILRYAGGKPKGKKAFAEGGGPPAPRKEADEEPEVTSLGDIVRARRMARRGNRASAA